MRVLIPILFGFTSCDAVSMPMETALSAVGVSCGEVATLPDGTFATAVLMVGTISVEPEVYEVYAAPLSWEQVGSDVYAECPEDAQTDASIHSIVVYYAATL